MEEKILNYFVIKLKLFLQALVWKLFLLIYQGHSGCPHKWNVHHECILHCRTFWGAGQKEPTDTVSLIKLYKNLFWFDHWTLRIWSGSSYQVISIRIFFGSGSFSDPDPFRIRPYYVNCFKLHKIFLLDGSNFKVCPNKFKHTVRLRDFMGQNVKFDTWKAYFLKLIFPFSARIWIRNG